jgi:hypothetical protein
MPTTPWGCGPGLENPVPKGETPEEPRISKLRVGVFNMSPKTTTACLHAFVMAK